VHHLVQHPAPGTHLLACAGDTVTFTLRVPSGTAGSAFLRTNAVRADLRRAEIIAHTEHERPFLASDWLDIPMQRIGADLFEVRLPLLHPGWFAAKCCLMPEGRPGPEWPEGDNTSLKVASAASACANTLYTAFVRQFTADMRPPAKPELDAATVPLDAAGYTVIPPSGTFRNLIRQLDFIIGTLGFRIIQLLPIHPTPTTYARMGRFGSPFAGLDFLDVDPALAEFDRRTTPLDQFRELADAVHARGARLLIDLPANHTGWASTLQTHHPEWFERNADGTFTSPGAWGTIWADLVALDYTQPGLRAAMADVFLFWCRQGCDGFRCDAGYMIPTETWRYIVARVRQAYPETLFLLEGLGGKIEVTDELLTEANLDWAYSEIFQEEDRRALERYLPDAIARSQTIGPLIHFAETHDNNRLAARGPVHARMRTALAALLSQSGAFGITNGVEWLATEKINVHGATDLRWNAPDNQVEAIARLNRLLARHPAFGFGATVELVQRGGGNVVVARRTAPQGKTLLVVANLDAGHAHTAEWPTGVFTPDTAWDLLTGKTVTIQRQRHATLDLRPGEVFCLTTCRADLDLLSAPDGDEPETARRQRNLLALRTRYWLTGAVALPHDLPPDELGDSLVADPVAFCAETLPPASRTARPHHSRTGGSPCPPNVAAFDKARDKARDKVGTQPNPTAPQGQGLECASGGIPLPPVVIWQWPRDLHRTVMLPPGFLLLVRANVPFHASLCEDDRVVATSASIRLADGTPATILPTWSSSSGPVPERQLRLHLARFTGGSAVHEEAPLLALAPAGDETTVRLRLDGATIRARHDYALLTNGRGAMAQIRAAWGTIRSQYDALLAVNPHPDVPDNRRIFFTRCRAWVRYRGYSHALDAACTDTFEADPGGTAAVWRFLTPVGMGRRVAISFTATLLRDRNRLDLHVRREPLAADDHEALGDSEPVTLILRPDIEARDFHTKTQAFTGPEHHFPAAVTAAPDGFGFAPAPGESYRMAIATGSFHHEPCWTYAVAHPEEAERGLGPHSDLFSPGWFETTLAAGDTAVLTAATAGDFAETAGTPAPPPPQTVPQLPFEETLRRALDTFVVARDGLRTVIAGYPWFLDWGRDTLIVLRGLAAAGYGREALKILREFGRLESRGTLPNMIRGADHGNRETSDAPLWFFIATRDLISALGHDAVLDAPCGDRPLREVLRSIAHHMLEGTPNGIRTDPATGLVYSPPHYTWMDTNYPAATPRTGYPVDIQALWIAGLAMLREQLGDTQLADIETRARQSLLRYFVLPEGWLADNLRAEPGQGAAEAVAEDALRPNQLLAVTLGAIDPRSPVARSVVAACAELLVPGGIRSLADRPVRVPQPVYGQHGLLNDPYRPYWGHYLGDEDTRRKPAYHNGTAWGWPFPLFCEAWLAVYGDAARAPARALLGSARGLLESGCIGNLPEIIDGNTPHTQRGCGAQAWSISELLRVWLLCKPE
jgi:glycogen debranching enzyme